MIVHSWQRSGVVSQQRLRLRRFDIHQTFTWTEVWTCFIPIFSLFFSILLAAPLWIPLLLFDEIIYGRSLNFGRENQDLTMRTFSFKPLIDEMKVLILIPSLYVRRNKWIFQTVWGEKTSDNTFPASNVKFFRGCIWRSHQ